MSKLIELTNLKREFETIGGSVFYSPHQTRMLTADHLREIADELDRLNGEELPMKVVRWHPATRADIGRLCRVRDDGGKWVEDNHNRYLHEVDERGFWFKYANGELGQFRWDYCEVLK